MKNAAKKQRERERVSHQVREIAQRHHLDSLSPERLVELIADGEPGVDWAAQGELEARGSRSLDALVGGLTHPDRKVRGTCALILDHQADDRCSEALLHAMRHDPLESVRRCAMHALSCEACKPAPLSVDAVAALIEAARTDRSKQVRQRAVFYLSGRHDDPRVVPAIVKLLETETDPVTRSRARRLLSAVDPDDREAVTADAACQDPDVQRARGVLECPAGTGLWDRLARASPLPMMAAARSLASDATPPLRVRLREGLGHSDWRVRRTCAAVLGAVGDGGSSEPLRAALQDPKEDVRRMALQALLSLARRRFFPEADMVDVLTSLATTDRSRVVRRVAVGALGDRMPDGRIAAALRGVSTNEGDPSLLAHAHRALRKQGRREAPAAGRTPREV